MVRITFLASAAFISIGASEVPSPKFDLVCSGILTTKSFFQDSSEAYTSHLRIDLQQRKWCEGECKGLHDIVDVQPIAITLEDTKVDTISERSLLNNTINRETGEQRILSTSADPRQRGSALIMQWVGKCDPAAFSGFPSFKTQF